MIGALWFAGSSAARRISGTAFPSLGLLVLAAVQCIGGGRHYPSDLVFAGLLVITLSLGLACLLWLRVAGSVAMRPSVPAP